MSVTVLLLSAALISIDYCVGLTHEESVELLEKYNIGHLWYALEESKYDISLWQDIDQDMLKNMNVLDSDRLRFKKLQNELKQQNQSNWTNRIVVILNSAAAKLVASIVAFVAMIFTKYKEMKACFASLFPMNKKETDMIHTPREDTPNVEPMTNSQGQKESNQAIDDETKTTPSNSLHNTPPTLTHDDSNARDNTPETIVVPDTHSEGQKKCTTDSTIQNDSVSETKRIATESKSKRLSRAPRTLIPKNKEKTMTDTDKKQLIMSQKRRHRELVIDTCNKITRNTIDNPLELLQSTIDSLKSQKSNVSEISLLYCLQSKCYFKMDLYDKAYKCTMAAAQVDSDREQVLFALIRIYTPQNNDNEGVRSNPHEDDEKAHQYCIKLESLYPDDVQSLYVASHCYSALGLYDKAIRILKRVFSKISALKQSNNNTALDTAKRRITRTMIRRYHNCSKNSHETIIRYLIELIEWKYNNLNAATLQTYIEEIWERIEYILNEHMDLNRINLHKMESEWNTILKLLCSIPCSIPLSAHLMNYIFDVFMRNSDFKCGVQFFTRLIAGYQTFNGNGLSIHATFDKYDVLYLNRAKLYYFLGAKKEMLDDIEYCNRRLLRNARTKKELVIMNEGNVAQYVFQDANEKPIIETSQQIKISEPVADRNQTNEVDTDEKEEEECKEHATTNDSENENKTDETLSQRKASPTLDVKAIDIHTKTPHPPSKVSQTMTHRDVSSEKSMVDTPDMDGKDGEESTEQSITNSDSEGETKTQETQDDEDNKRNKQSIKDSKAETKQNDNNPIDGKNNAIEWQTGPNGGRYYVTESGDKYYNSTDATLIYGEDEYGRILYRGVKGGYYFLSGTGQSKQYVTLPKDIVEAYRKRHLKFINVQSDSE